MQTLFSPKRDYRAWTRKRLPVVKELVLLGFSREEIAEALKASTSTIQRDLHELRQRRSIASELPSYNYEKQKKLVTQRLSALENMMIDDSVDETNEALCHALRSWAKKHHLSEQKAKQTRMPFMTNS